MPDPGVDPLTHTRWRVFQGGLSGRYFAALSSERGDDVWVVIGTKHDVTDDIEQILEQERQ